MNVKTGTFILLGLLFSLVLGIFISPFASSHPDGLEWVAEEKGFLESAENTEPTWNSSPIPDYAVPGIENEGIATASAGLIGTLLLFGSGWGFAKLVSGGKSETDGNTG